MEPEPELKFPMTFDKCPHCGSTKRIAETVVNEEKAKGRINQKAHASITQFQTLIADPTRLLLSAPGLVTFMDICANPNCGALYAVRIEKVTMQIKTQMPPGQDMKGFGFPQQGLGRS